MAMKGSLRRADLYPNQGRNTVEAANQGMAENQMQTAAPAQLGRANTGAPTSGNAAGILISIILLFVALQFFALKTGDASDYKGIAPSFWNVMLITLAGMLGGTVLKAFANSVFPPNSAFRQFVNAAA